jgi:hypothetical protein
MKNFAIALAITTITLIAGCSLRSIHGDGSITSENRSISDFTTIDAAGSFDIQWTSGQSALSITTDQNLLAHIRTVVSGDTLRIYSDEALAPTKGIKVVLSSRAIKDLDLKGAVHLAANQISGAQLNISSSGAVSIDANGKVTTLTATLTGASHLKASALNANTAAITLVGAANADVAATERLKASITGAGSLTYSGNPSLIEKSVTGTGTIHHRQ